MPEITVSEFTIPDLERIKNQINAQYSTELLRTHGDVVTFLTGYYEESVRRR